MPARHRTVTTSIIALAAGMGPVTGLASAQTTPTAARPADLIPRDVLFGNPDRANVTISPAGTHLAYLAPKDGVLNVWVRTIGAADDRAITDAEDRPIRTYFWAANSDQVVYAQDRGGDENFQLFAVSIADGAEVALTPMDGVQARVIATDRSHPDHILVAVNDRNPALHDVHKVDTRTGERELVLRNEQGWVGFTADANLDIRLGMRFLPDGGSEVHLKVDDAWEKLAAWPMEDAMSSGPAGIARDGRTLYLTDTAEADTMQLLAVDLETPGYPRRVIAEPGRADFSGTVVDPDTGHPQAVSRTFTRAEWEFLDPALRADWDFLSTVDDGELSINSRDDADDTWVVAFSHDDGPVKYYLYDRAARSAEYLFSNRPDLEGLPLAKMKPVVIRSRDGLDLVSYLTVPKDAEPHALPMVLLVHGGPWARDFWGFNPLHQWLANRGYAVLSVNFRGSTGLGKAFLNAGNREWAGKMHDDLLDAVQWAVSEGIADPDRVAIMGGSYGGYATLVGLTFTPDVFAAGVDIVGPSHVGTLLSTIPPYWAPMKSLFETRVGAFEDQAYLDSISPLTKVDAITKPLLIGQGANDPRVKEAESEQIVAAMTERQIPVTYVLFPDEGHGFAKPTNSMAFWAVTEAFLAEHLGGQYQPIGDDVRNSTARIPAGRDLLPGLEK